MATNGPGPRDIIADGENGFLVEATDEVVLLGLRRTLSLHPDERERFTQRAPKTVEERFEISAAIQTALEAMEIPRRQARVKLFTGRRGFDVADTLPTAIANARAVPSMNDRSSAQPGVSREGRSWVLLLLIVAPGAYLRFTYRR